MDKAQAANELKRRGVTLEDMQNYFLAVAEPIAAMGSGIIAEPVAGFAGLAAAPFGSDAAANAVNYYRDKLTYSPRSEAGQSGMAAVGEAMAPIGEAMDYAASGAGDYIYDKTGSPALAAAAYSAPTAALELLGLKGVNQLSKSGKLGQPLEFGDIGIGGVGNKQRGIFAGVKAKGADLKRQAAAEELANRGIGRDQIWQETGWFNDVDGNWKFEIDDSQSRLKLENFDKHSFGGIADYDAHRLGGVLDSEALTQYPELAKYEQSILASDVADPDNIGGSFEPDSKRIRVVATDFDKAKSATLHELTHAIQQEEGFAKGGSADRLMGQYKKDLNNKDYYAQAATDERLAARKTPEYMDIQKKIDVALANGDKEALKPLVEARRAIENEVADIFDQEVARLADKTRFDPFEQYQRLAGEAEARNVQTRMDYTPEQRQAAAPWTTLDVPESELIVRGNSKGPMMSVNGPKQVNLDNKYLFDFNPDSLVKTEFDYKDISKYQDGGYKGDGKRPITLTEKNGEYHILDGHHRTKLAQHRGQDVRGVVIPEDDFNVMSGKGIHPADMLKEWIATGGPKKESSNGPMMSVSKAQAIEELEKRGIPMGEALRGKYVDVGRLSDELELATSQLNQRRLNLPDGHILIKSGEKRVAKAQKALTKGAEQQGKFAAWFGDSKASSNGSPKTLYHGSTKDINDFRRGRDNRAFWAAEDTNVANSYAGDREGAVIYPLNMKMENPLVHDAESASWMDLTYNGERLSTDDLADIAQEAGHDGLIIKNIRDMDTDDGGDVPSDHYAVFDSANIRSPNAAFNPKDIGKSGLLKSVGGVGLGYQFLSGEDEQNQF